MRIRIIWQVRGRFLSGQSDEELRLFDISDTLWSKDIDGAALAPLLSNKKLSGTHSWPFSVMIPEKVQFKGDNSGGSAQGNIDHNTP